MPNPTKRHTRQHKGARRSHDALKPINIVFDADGNPHLPHHATLMSGKYKGRTVINTAKRAARLTKKK